MLEWGGFSTRLSLLAWSFRIRGRVPKISGSLGCESGDLFPVRQAGPFSSKHPVVDYVLGSMCDESDRL